MVLRRPKDLYSGVLFLIIGAGTLALSGGLPFGTARSMGPGYFPTVLGCLLCVLALLQVVKSFFGAPDPIDPFNVATARAAIGVLGGTVLFGLLVRQAGLAPTLLITTLISALGLRGFGVKPAVVLALVLSVGCSIIFVQLLGLPVPILGSLFDGQD
ncbi:tripartite tricarboxylate transporter TctB family protein [Tianweitania sediminis]|jgi:hypothetical protein|uniref:Tripartite tricarboxylate transporter TctB family protein n=1 Tax=Tianweitania sediminis TaxID=1502156 RepID=A0A8J7UN66_9HYPH|nr:tripartite tricarboxylate transporter TctB family protein [Tianweitania sediminis]MBP0441172.1 tripartite tricarboxylate transporter TctB family protein [Tianweitania sediminis]